MNSYIYDESKEYSGIVDEESEIDKKDLELDLEEDLEDEDIISEVDDY